MDYKIDRSPQVKKEKPTNKYEIIIEFMEGDADGSNQVGFMFREELISKPGFKKTLDEFVQSVLDCVEQDSHGRGGFESIKDLISEYGQIKNWHKFVNVEDWLDEDDKEDLKETQGFTDEDFNPYNTIFGYEVPNYSQGWYDSYDNLNMYYYDEIGDKFPVIISQ